MAQAQAVVAAEPAGGEIIESVIIKGDLSKLTPQERTRYYVEVCKSVGLNPLTKPFEYITLNNKLTLYALRNCTDQLRTIHGVSVEDLTESEREGVFIVTAKVRNKEGRTDIAKGAVTISSLKGDALANAMMKAETKAKRRATLSICGLGFLDETEIETIPASARAPAPQPTPIAPPVVEPPHDPATGEVKPHQITIGYIEGQDGRDHSDWLGWGKTMIAAVKSAKTSDELSSWIELNQTALANCAENAPKAYNSVNGAIQKRRKELGPVADAELADETDAKNFLTGC